MAYDEGLAQRVRETLSERDDLSERKMFGGLCYMLGGNMCAGTVGGELMLRVGPKEYGVGPNEDHGHDERNHLDAHDQPPLGLTP